MEDATPTFCKEFLSKKPKINFSKACEKMVIRRPKGKYSCSNVKNLDGKEKTKHKKDHAYKKRHQSQKIKLSDFSDINEIDEVKINNNTDTSTNHHHKKHKEIIKSNNINNFMKKHKFKLINDFDKKHAEQFLLSKEEAFEKPYIFFVEQ